MNLKVSKFVSYIILCVALAVLLYFNASILNESITALSDIYQYLQNVILVFALCILLSPFLGILMHLYKVFRIFAGILLFILLSGFCVFFAFPSGMVLGKPLAIFLFTLLPAVFSGAHFVYLQLLNPSKTALNLLQRGTNKKRVTRLTSLKTAYASFFDSADFTLTVILFSSAASSYILNFENNIFTVPALILLLCSFAVISLISLVFAWILYR